MRKKTKTGLAACLSAAVVMGSVIGCGNRQAATSEDVLTQKETESQRTQITVLVKHAFSINTFEKTVEEKFPDIDIVQVNNYTRDMGVEEYKSRLAHDDLTDMVMTWPLSVGEEYWEERLIDLSKYDFTSRYNLSILNDISRDGKLYYLPGPSQVRGIVYNKTMFEQKGWEVPTDFDGFVELCKTIEATGMRSLQLGFENSEVLDTAFVGFSFGACYSQLDDIRWIQEYNDGEHSFGEHFMPALNTFERMMEAGIFTGRDLEVSYADREDMLFNRRCAMVEDSALMAQLGYSRTGITDEFALMPFFNPGEGQDWARLYMVCYVGLNKHLEEPQNKKKYDLVMELMEYISTPEGQAALMGDTRAMFSSLTGVAPPAEPEIASMTTALREGRLAVFPVLKNSQGALREGLAGMLRGEMTKEDVIALVDAQNANPPKAAVPRRIGEAKEDFTLMETGNFIADCLREYSGCDVGLFLDNGKDGIHNGKGVSGRLYQGSITQTDVERVLPDLKHGENGTLWKVSMTGENLLKTLEYTVEVDNGVGGWFYYISGLRLEYDVKAEPGSRICKVTMSDKSAVDPQRIYTVAVMDYSVPEDCIQSYEETEVTVSQIVTEAIEKAGTIAPQKDGRLKVVESK